MKNRVGRPYTTSHEIMAEYLALDASAFSKAKNSTRNYQRAMRATKRIEKIERWFKLVKKDLTFHQIQAFQECFKIDYGREQNNNGTQELPE